MKQNKKQKQKTLLGELEGLDKLLSLLKETVTTCRWQSLPKNKNTRYRSGKLQQNQERGKQVRQAAT